MPVFTPNVPVETDTPFVEVERLRPGQHRFQLVVVDEAGNPSRPDTVTVTVVAPDNMVTVPPVLQKRVEDAKAILANAGLVMDIADRVQTNNQEENTVLRQLPPAGARVERGSAVRLSVAVRQFNRVTVPSVVGKQAADARKALSDVGLTINVTAQVASTRPDGTVLSQTPSAGAVVSAGSAVQVTVSRRQG